MTLSTCGFFQSSFFYVDFWQLATCHFKTLFTQFDSQSFDAMKKRGSTTYWAIVVVVEFLCSCQFACMLNLKVKSAASKTVWFLTLCRTVEFHFCSECYIYCSLRDLQFNCFLMIIYGCSSLSKLSFKLIPFSIRSIVGFFINWKKTSFKIYQFKNL